MVPHHCLAKSISDVGWSEFVRQLEYKSQWYGRALVKIDRWYPSTKTCHECKHVMQDLPLDMREWVCPACGAFHDRDTNAARNILAEGLSVSACGGSVRPKRAKARRATPNEAGTSQPRGGEASGFIQGRMSQTKQAEFSSCEKGMGALSGLK
jgi:putative transposase